MFSDDIAEVFMANQRNYQRELDELTTSLEAEGRVPGLLLHACCAPCSSYCLEYLSRYFSVTLLYYNPNITSWEEYKRRFQELNRLVRQMPFSHPVILREGSFEPEKYFETVKGLEKDAEGGERCFRCYRLRMEEAAKEARDGQFDYFTTTLSISPLKNAYKINEIGEELAGIYQVRHLPSDFKKKDGFKRSIQLSSEYGLYRQDYCGCIFSKIAREQKQKSQ